MHHRSKKLQVVRSSEAGFSITEILIGVTVLAIFFSLIFYNMRDTMAYEKLLQSQKNLAALRMNIKALYSGQSNTFTGLTNTVALNSGIVPLSMVSGTSILNEWSSGVTLGTNATNTQFTITYGSVPKDACIKLGTAFADWDAVMVGSVNITDPASANTACSGATNNLVFYSK